MAEELNIKITTTADTAGAKAVNAAVQDVAKTTDRAANAARASRMETGKLGEAMQQASAAGKVLSEVASGNIGYIAQAGTALKGLFTVLRANPLGVFITALSLAATAFVTLREKFGWFKADVKDAADQANTSFGEVAAASNSANKEVEAFASRAGRFDDQMAALGDLAAKYDAVTAAIERMGRARDTLQDSRLGAVLGGLDQEEKLALSKAGKDPLAQSAVKLDFSQRRDNARQDSAETKAVEAEQEVKRRQAENNAKLDAGAKQQAAVGMEKIEIEAKRDNLTGDLGGLKRARSSLGDTRSQSPDQKRMASALDKEIASKTAELKAANDSIAKLEARIKQLELADVPLLGEQSALKTEAQAAFNNTRTTFSARTTMDQQQAQDSRNLAQTNTELRKQESEKQVHKDYLDRVSTGSVSMQEGAETIARSKGARDNPELMAAAKAAAEAARRGATDGATDAEAADIVSTFKALQAVLESNNTRYKTLDAAIKSLNEQIKNNRTTGGS